MFNPDDSTTFKYVEPAKYDRVRYLDGTILEGQIATDAVCVLLEDESCANDC